MDIHGLLIVFHLQLPRDSQCRFCHCSSQPSHEEIYSASGNDGTQEHAKGQWRKYTPAALELKVIRSTSEVNALSKESVDSRSRDTQRTQKLMLAALGMKYELWATQLKIMSSIMSGCSIQRWFGNQSNKTFSFFTITQPFKVTSSKLKSTCCTSLRLKLQEQHLTRKRKHTWPAAGWTQGCRV